MSSIEMCCIVVCLHRECLLSQRETSHTSLTPESTTTSTWWRTQWRMWVSYRPKTQTTYEWSESQPVCVHAGTSNWSADYFNTTAGVGLVLSQDARRSSFHQQLRAVFDRDWSSRYSHPLADLHRIHDCAFSTPAP